MFKAKKGGLIIWMMLSMMVLLASCAHSENAPAQTMNRKLVISVDDIRNDPDAISELYYYDKEQLDEILHKKGWDLGESAKYFIYCMVTAYQMAPYGNSRDVSETQ